MGAGGWLFDLSSPTCFYARLVKKTERSHSSISCSYSPRSGGSKGATGESFSTIVGVGRDSIRFNLEPPIDIPDTTLTTYPKIPT